MHSRSTGEVIFAVRRRQTLVLVDGETQVHPGLQASQGISVLTAIELLFQPSACHIRMEVLCMKEVEELACPFCGYARPRVKASAQTTPVCPRCGHRVGERPPSGPVPSELLSTLESRARELEVDKMELEQWVNEEARQADEDQSRVSMVSLREKIGRLARQHRGAGERLHLLRSEYQGLQKQLETVASNVEKYTPDPAVLEQKQAELLARIRDEEVGRLTELTRQLEDKLATEHGLRMTAARRIDVLEHALREADQARKSAEDLRHRKTETELARLQEERDRLRKECEARAQAASVLEARVQDLSQRQIELRKQEAERDRETADLERRQDELIQEAAERTREKVLADQRIADFERRAEAQIASAGKLLEYQQEQRLLQRQIEEMAQEWQARQYELEELRGANQAVSARNRSLEVDLAAAVRRAGESARRIAELEQDHDRAEIDRSVVAKLEEANRQLEADRTGLEQTHRQVQEQLEAALAARHSADIALDALQQHADRLARAADEDRSQRARLADEIRSLTKRFEEADRLRVQAEDRARELEARPQADPALEAMVRDLKSRNAELLKERSRIENDAARTRNRLQSQIGTTEQSMRQAETLNALNARLQEDIEALQTRVKRLREIETDLRTVAESVPPLEHQLQVLERENHALNAQFQETQRSLSDAATVVTQVTALRSELERLGRKYLQAREEIARGQRERMNLRDELSELADRVLSERREETGYSTAEVARARKQIRRAILKHLQPGPVDLSPDP